MRIETCFWVFWKGRSPPFGSATKRLPFVFLLMAFTVGCTEREEIPADTVILGTSLMAAADIEAGKVVATSCAECHGLDGKSTGPESPHLAAQNLRYLVFTLQAYRNQARGSPIMQVAALPLTDIDLVNVAGYYASLTPIRDAAKVPSIPWPKVTPNRAVAAGKTAAAACAGCHGATGKSAIAGTPTLAGQNAQYLVAAIRAYKDGTRRHAVMQAAVATLSDKGVENLAAFYSVQPPRVPVKQLFSLEERVARCNRCHEPSIRDPIFPFPNIKGQPAGYIAKALKAYQEESTRTNSMMHAMAVPLSDTEIQGIAAYYSQQQAK